MSTNPDTDNGVIKQVQGEKQPHCTPIILEGIP